MARRSVLVSLVLMLICVVLAGLGLPATGSMGTTIPSGSSSGQSASGSLKLLRNQIAAVGTWMEDPLRDSRTEKRKWVFTEEGVLKQYFGGELRSTVDYAIVQQCQDSEFGLQEPGSAQLAMIEITRPDGTVSCKLLTQMVEDSPDRPLFFTVRTRHGNLLFEQHSSNP